MADGKVNRKIGNDIISAIGWGAMGIGGILYGQNGSDEERLKFLDKGIELGCTHWDCSDSYGDAEVLIGKYFARNPEARSKVFLATKFGYVPGGVSGTPEYVHEACENSLKRLNVSYIDLYYQHRVDAKTPIEKTVGAMAELIKEGKVRYLGLSEPSPTTLRRAQAVHPISAIQFEYSPIMLEIEEKGHLLETARELGIPIVVYAPLGRGLITGEYKSYADLSETDFRKTVPKLSEENFPTILSLAEKIKAIGAQHNATSAQVTLAWLLAQGDDIIPIPGTKKIKYLEENLGALNVKLSAEEVAEIRTLCEKTKVPGTRYKAAMMHLVMGDTPPLE